MLSGRTKFHSETPGFTVNLEKFYKRYRYPYKEPAQQLTRNEKGYADALISFLSIDGKDKEEINKRKLDFFNLLCDATERRDTALFTYYAEQTGKDTKAHGAIFTAVGYLELINDPDCSQTIKNAAQTNLENLFIWAMRNKPDIAAHIITLAPQFWTSPLPSGNTFMHYYANNCGIPLKTLPMTAEEAVKIAFCQNKRGQTPYGLAVQNKFGVQKDFLLTMLKPFKTALLKALRANDIKAIQSLINGIPKPDLLDLPLNDENATIYHIAAQYLSLANVKLLLPAIDAKEMIGPLFKIDKNNRRPYRYACVNSDPGVLEYFLSATNNIYNLRKDVSAAKLIPRGKTVEQIDETIEQIDRCSSKTGYSYADVLFGLDYSKAESLEKVRSLLIYGADLAARPGNQTLAIYMLERNLGIIKVVIDLLREGKLPSVTHATLLEMAGYLHKHMTSVVHAEDVFELSRHALAKHGALQTVVPDGANKDKTHALLLLEENPYMADAFIKALFQEEKKQPAGFASNKVRYQVLAHLFKLLEQGDKKNRDSVILALDTVLSRKKLTSPPDEDQIRLFQLAAAHLPKAALARALPMDDLKYCSPRVFNIINDRTVLKWALFNPDTQALQYILDLREAIFTQHATTMDSNVKRHFTLQKESYCKLIFALDFSTLDLDLQRMEMLLKQGVDMEFKNKAGKTLTQHLLGKGQAVVVRLVRLIKEGSVTIASSDLLDITQRFRQQLAGKDIIYLSTLALTQWESSGHLTKADAKGNVNIKQLLENDLSLAPYLISLLKEGKLPKVLNDPKTMHQIILHLWEKNSSEAPYTRQDILDLLIQALKQKQTLAEKPVDKDQMGLFFLAAKYLPADQLAVVLPREENARNYIQARIFTVFNDNSLLQSSLDNADPDALAYLLQLRADAFKIFDAQKETAKKTADDTLIEKRASEKGGTYARALLRAASNSVEAHRKIQLLLEYGADLAVKAAGEKTTAKCLLEKDVAAARILINLLKEAKLPALASNPVLLLEIAEHLKTHIQDQGTLFTVKDVAYLADLGLTALHQQRSLSQSLAVAPASDTGASHENLIHQINGEGQASKTIAKIDFEKEQERRLELRRLKTIIESDQPDDPERRKAFHDYQRAMDEYNKAKNTYDNANARERKRLAVPKKPVYVQIKLSEQEIYERRLAAYQALHKKFSEGDAYATVLLADIYFANRVPVAPPPQPAAAPQPEKKSWWSRRPSKNIPSNVNTPVKPAPAPVVFGAQQNNQMQTAKNTYTNLAREVPEFKAYAEWMLKRIEASKEKINQHTDITQTATYQTLLMAFKLIATNDAQQLMAKQYILDLSQNEKNQLVLNTAKLFAAIALHGGRGQLSDQVDIKKSLPLGKEANNAHAIWNRSKAGLAPHVYQQVIHDIGDAMTVCEEKMKKRKFSDNACETLTKEKKEIVRPVQPAPTVSRPVAIPKKSFSQYPSLSQLWSPSSKSPAPLPVLEAHPAKAIPVGRPAASAIRSCEKTVKLPSSLPDRIASNMFPKVPQAPVGDTTTPASPTLNRIKTHAT